MSNGGPCGPEPEPEPDGGPRPRVSQSQSQSQKQNQAGRACGVRQKVSDVKRSSIGRSVPPFESNLRVDGASASLDQFELLIVDWRIIWTSARFSTEPLTTILLLCYVVLLFGGRAYAVSNSIVVVVFVGCVFHSTRRSPHCLLT